MSYISELRKFVGTKRIISVSCGALIENEKEELLLQFRSDTNNFGIPGGNMELGENLFDTLKREIYEETGLVITPNTCRLFGVYSGEQCVTIYPNGDEVQYVIFVYHCLINSKEKIVNDNSEALFLKYFSRGNLPDNIKSNDKIWIKKWEKGNYELVVD